VHDRHRLHGGEPQEHGRRAEVGTAPEQEDRDQRRGDHRREREQHEADALPEAESCGRNGDLERAPTAFDSELERLARQPRAPGATGGRGQLDRCAIDGQQHVALLEQAECGGSDHLGDAQRAVGRAFE
jgi:hypothetical protein